MAGITLEDYWGLHDIVVEHCIAKVCKNQRGSLHDEMRIEISVWLQGTSTEYRMN